MENNIFAIDPTPYNIRQKTNEETPNYFLKNFEHYQPKLIKDFYLKHFMKNLFFDIDILEIEEFLDTQFEYSENPGFLQKILQRKILPKFEEVIQNSKFSPHTKYFKEETLEDEFVLTEGTIKNWNYEFESFYHKCQTGNLREDLMERKKITSNYLGRLEKLFNKSNPNSLQWVGKPSHLAIIISKLTDLNYIEAPLLKNGEVNYNELSRQILNSFNFKIKPSLDTLRKYANPKNDKYQELSDKFDDKTFNLPHSKIMS
ncbi:hypothetical protein [Mangrovimonas xylaniphaga]|uniref:hypothetical protein n=1 Tax=Mangrovimonas xylaniphaga TaxID=1645915 RepID=UPI0006B4B9B2|nr:hypothetical protein [Mangrovimonas xylaniphaga]